MEKSCCQESLAWDLCWIVGGVFRVRLEEMLSSFVYYVIVRFFLFHADCVM